MAACGEQRYGKCTRKATGKTERKTGTPSTSKNRGERLQESLAAVSYAGCIRTLSHFVRVKEIDVECVAVAPVPVTVSV